MKMDRGIVVLLIGVLLVTAINSVQADSLSPVTTITESAGELVDLTYNGTTYVTANNDLILGETRRYYIHPDTGIHTWWVDGTDPWPLEGVYTETVGGTSTPKPGDIGAKADNYLFRTASGSTDISSIDGIDYQQTIFSQLVDTIFVFERGGNDNGFVYPILADDSLGTGLQLAAGGAPYGNTGVGVNGQTAFGYVLETDVPVKGLRIEASGHDALTIAAVPEPITLSLLAFGGLAVVRRRRR